MATSSSIHSVRWLLFGLTITTALTGCGPSGPTVVPVTGVATRGGKPVPNLYMTFMPENGRTSWSVSDADGKFKLNYDRDQDGAVLGKHKVFVKFKAATVQIEMQMNAGTYKPPADLAAILEKYGDADKTPMTVEITPESTKGIELKFD